MSLPEKLDMMERVGELHLKSYKPAEIARALNISPAAAKKYIESYREVLQRQVMEDPEYLERVAENTIEALERLDNLVKEAWETYETAKNNDMVNQQINLLKVAGTLEAQRANLLQLMGAKMDSGMTARLNRAEQVNDIVSRIIKEVIAHCDKCRVEVQPRLAEAFATMGKAEEAADMRSAEHQPSEDDIIDVEVIESEEDHKSMMLDVIAND